MTQSGVEVVVVMVVEAGVEVVVVVVVEADVRGCCFNNIKSEISVPVGGG